MCTASVDTKDNSRNGRKQLLDAQVGDNERDLFDLNAVANGGSLHRSVGIVIDKNSSSAPLCDSWMPEMPQASVGRRKRGANRITAVWHFLWGNKRLSLHCILTRFVRRPH